MDAGVLVAAIGPRATPVPTKDAKRKSWFELMYEVVTPDHPGYELEL